MIVQSDDVELHVAVDGDDDAPPLLLLHGITSSGRTWDWLVPSLADRYRVLRLDFRGHGRSARAPGTYLPDAYVADAVAALEQAAGRPAVLIGHSLGGVTAAAVAQRRPDLLVAAVMEDPPLFAPGPGGAATLEGGPVLDGFRLMRQSVPGLQDSGIDVATLAGILGGAPDPSGASTFGELLHPDGVVSMAASLLEVDITVLDPVLDGTVTSFVDAHAPFAVPSLVLTGDPARPDTVARPAAAAHFASISPDVEVVVVVGAGHLAHDERSSRDRWVEAVTSFLARVAAEA